MSIIKLKDGKTYNLNVITWLADTKTELDNFTGMKFGDIGQLPDGTTYRYSSDGVWVEQKGAGIDEVTREALAAFATDTESGEIITFSDGADEIPVKSAVVSVTSETYVVEPNFYLDPNGSHSVSKYEREYPRCIVFPVVGDGETEYAISSGVSATMRVGSFTEYPIVGTNPNVFVTATDDSISIIPAMGDKWILCQFFVDTDAGMGTTITLPLALAGFAVSPAVVWDYVNVRRDSKNRVDNSTMSNQYWTDTGTLTSGSSMRHTVFFRVDGGKKYTWSVNHVYSGTLYAAWFTDDMEFISTSSLSDAASVVVTAPTTAKWVSLSSRNYSDQFVQFEVGENATADAAFNETTTLVRVSDGTIDGTLTTLKGVNNMWADVGTLTVEYRADTAMYIDKKISEIPSASGVSF